MIGLSEFVFISEVPTTTSVTTTSVTTTLTPTTATGTATIGRKPITATEPRFLNLQTKLGED